MSRKVLILGGEAEVTRITVRQAPATMDLNKLQFQYLVDMQLTFTAGAKEIVGRTFLAQLDILLPSSALGELLDQIPPTDIIPLVLSAELRNYLREKDLIWDDVLPLSLESENASFTAQAHPREFLIDLQSGENLTALSIIRFRSVEAPIPCMTTFWVDADSHPEFGWNTVTGNGGRILMYERHVDGTVTISCTYGLTPIPTETLTGRAALAFIRLIASGGKCEQLEDPPDSLSNVFKNHPLSSCWIRGNKKQGFALGFDIEKFQRKFPDLDET